MTRVTLCMIARNEESLLPACLESVRELVDDIVIVDTGSTDGTISVARRFNARVIHEAWADDFAKARNTALGYAKGDWVLQLDADERLTARGVRRLREVLKQPLEFDCGLLPLHNADALDATDEDVVSGRRRLGAPSWLPRLLRRSAGLRYDGLIHESVLDSLAARGSKMRRVEGVDVVHVGATAAFRVQRGKVERNLKLLRQRCAVEPHNVLPFGYLALELVHAGRHQEAGEVVAQGWPLVDTQPAHRSTLRLAVARGLCALAKDDAEGIEQTVHTVAKREGAHPDLSFLLGCAAEVHGYRATSTLEARPHFEAAERAYRQCVATSWQVNDSYIDAATGWAGWLRLATMQLALERHGDARTSLTTVLEQRPGLIDAELGMVEVALGEGQPMQALKAAEPLLTKAPDGWALAAAAALMLCAPSDARLLYARALERGGPAGLLSRHRTALLSRLGDALAVTHAANDLAPRAVGS